MRKTFLSVSIVAALLVAFYGEQAFADSISISSVLRDVDPTEVGDSQAPAPDGGTVQMFFVDTDEDIIAINFVRTQADQPFYQHPFGTDNAPGNPALIPSFPGLAADTWITTPGDTLVLGGGLPADGDDTFGDTDDNGPQNNFQFAQFTLPPGALGVFEGQFDIRSNTGGIFSQNFSLPLGIPEPTSIALVGIGLIALVGSRRK